MILYGQWHFIGDTYIDIAYNQIGILRNLYDLNLTVLVTILYVLECYFTIQICYLQ